MSMKNKYKKNPDLATVVVTEDFGTMINMPNGDSIPGLIFTRVTDNIDEAPYVIAKFYVNLERTV